MRTYAYAAVFEPTEREGGFVVTFPDVPEAITEGDDMADAREQAADALGVALLTYLEMGRSLSALRAFPELNSPAGLARTKRRRAACLIQTLRPSFPS